MVTVGEIILYILITGAILVLLLWLSSRDFVRKKFGGDKYYNKLGFRRAVTVEEIAEGKKIDDYIKKQSQKHLTQNYPVSVKSTRNVASSVPYEVPGIHEVITEKPYSSRTRTSTAVLSSITSGSRVRNKMTRYYEILSTERNPEKIAELNDSLYKIISDTDPLKIETFQHSPGLVFDYNRKSTYFNIRGAGINFTRDKDLLFVAFFKNKLSVAMDIRKPTDVTKEITILEGKFSLHSSIPDAAFKILEDKKVKSLLVNITDDIKRLYYEDDQLFALLKSTVNLKDILDLTNLIFHSSYKLEEYADRIEELKCYNCGDAFDQAEEFCDKCDAPRPTCIVCLLDLKPQEKEKVMKLPCCGIYAHSEHIEKWLYKNTRCPNCQENLAKLLRKSHKT